MFFVVAPAGIGKKGIRFVAGAHSSSQYTVCEA